MWNVDEGIQYLLRGGQAFLIEWP